MYKNYTYSKKWYFIMLIRFFYFWHSNDNEQWRIDFFCFLHSTSSVVVFLWTLPTIRLKTPASDAIVLEKHTDKVESGLGQEKVLFHALGFGKISLFINTHKECMYLFMYMASEEFGLVNAMQVLALISLIIRFWQSKTKKNSKYSTL